MIYLDLALLTLIGLLWVAFGAGEIHRFRENRRAMKEDRSAKTSSDNDLQTGP